MVNAVLHIATLIVRSRRRSSVLEKVRNTLNIILRQRSPLGSTSGAPFGGRLRFTSYLMFLLDEKFEV